MDDHTNQGTAITLCIACHGELFHLEHENMAVKKTVVQEFISEKFLQNAIIDWLNTSTAGMFWQNDSVAIRGRKRCNRYRPNGVSDILGVISGQFIAIEVKSPTGKLLQSQIEFSQRFRRAGGEYYVIRSLEDLTELAKISGWI
jgi:hypothetical protein